MPTVVDLANPVALDKRLSTPNRNIAGSPYGVLTPQYAGEMVLDTVGNQLWSTGGGGLTTTSWIPVTKVY